MQKIPCEDCITIAICKQIILNDLDFPLTNLRCKCSLFEKFFNDYYICDHEELCLDMYTILEKFFKLDFKIRHKQKDIYNNIIKCSASNL